MNHKKLHKRDEIIDAAFRVWGRDLFGRMSLQDLTEDLGVTKPSLYRHFRSKNDLIRAMTERAVSLLQQERDDLVRITATSEPVNVRLRNAVYRHLELTLSHLDVIHFSGYLYRKDPATAREIERLNDETFGLISRNLGVSIVAVHYLYTLLVLLIFLEHLPETGNDCRLKPPDEGALPLVMRERVEGVIGLFRKGFKGKQYSRDPDFEGIYTFLEGFDYSAIMEDRILQAVYEALLDEGDLVTSLSRVAEKAGLKKSSLYSHFKSKEEMLTQSLREQKNRYMEAYTRFLEAFPETVDKLFAHLAFSHGFVRRYPKTIEMMDKLVSMDIFTDQDHGEHARNRFFLSLLDQAFEAELLDSKFLDRDSLSYFLNMAMIIEIRYIRFHPELTDVQKNEHIVRLYRIFVHGVEEIQEGV